MFDMFDIFMDYSGMNVVKTIEKLGSESGLPKGKIIIDQCGTV